MRANLVAIVGGGIAGLATAFELQRRGQPFLLLESRPRPGGLILSEEIDGFTIDGGPDALLAQKSEGIRLCADLGIADRLMPTRPPRLAFIQRDGRLHALPAGSVLGIPTKVGPFLRTRLFSARGKARMAAELFVPRRTDDADESIGEFVTRRFGREAATYLAEPLLAGIHAGDVNKLSIKALFPRFPQAERQYGSLLRAFRHQRPVPSQHGAFRSLPRGLSELVNAIVAATPSASIRVGSMVTRVSGNAHEGYRLEIQGGGIVEASSIVMAVPAYVAARLLRDVDAEIAQLLAEVQYTSTATVALAFRREAVRHPLNGSGFVVPRVEPSRILAATWLSSKWDGRAPAGHALIRTFLGGTRDPQAFEREDAELVQLSLQALRPLLGVTADPLFTRVYRWERAGAQHEVGHLERVGRIESALARHPGLFITGSALRGVGIPDCVADGRATAVQATRVIGCGRPATAS